MYKSILWDNDGILVNTEEWYYQATKKVMNEHGFNLTLDIYNETFLKNNQGAWHLINDIDKNIIPNLRAKRNKIYSNFLKTEDIFIKDASKVLKLLFKKYKMGIVTSSRRDHFNIIHKRSNLLKYFQFIVANDEFSNSKPHPEPYLIGLNKSGFNVKECLAIEDSERGMRSAKNAKLDCWVIPTKLTEKSDFNDADKVINNINELTTLL